MRREDFRPRVARCGDRSVDQTDVDRGEEQTVRHDDPRVRVHVGMSGVRAEISPLAGASVVGRFAQLKRRVAAAAPYDVAPVLVAELTTDRLVIDARRRR
jgi:hypothetical protein